MIGEIGRMTMEWSRSRMTCSRRRVMTQASLVGMSGVVVAACARASTSGPAPQAETPATIQFWPTWAAQFQVDGINKMAQAYHQEHPLITIEVTPYSGNYAKIISADAAGSPPDMHSLPGDQMGPFARQQLTQALEPFIAKSQLKERFFPAQWEVATRNGKIHGVPAWDHHPNPILFWNQAHFEEAGYPTDKGPATLDEARKYAERLTKANADGGILRLGFDPLAESGNGLLGYWATAYNVTTWYDDKTHKFNFNQPGLVAALDYIGGLYKLYGPDQVKAYRAKYGTFNSPTAGMPQGVESMKVSSGVSTGTLALNAAQVRVGVGWTPLEKARKYVEVGGGHFNVLATGAAHADQAWQFIAWLTTPVANQLMLASIGWIAYNKDLAKGLDVSHVPNMRFVLDAPTKADQVAAPIVLPISTAAMADGVQRVINGQQGPREMLADVQKQLQYDLDDVLRGADSLRSCFG